MRLLAPLLLLLSLVSCAESTSLWASSYQNTCAVDEDCAVVRIGDICECSCKFGAISVLDLERYEKDKDDVFCEPRAYGCTACQLPTAVCTNGFCDVAY